MAEAVQTVKLAASNPGPNATTEPAKDNPGQKDNPGEPERTGNPIAADGGDLPRRLGWLVFVGLILAGLAVIAQARS